MFLFEIDRFRFEIEYRWRGKLLSGTYYCLYDGPKVRTVRTTVFQARSDKRKIIRDMKLS